MIDFIVKRRYTGGYIMTDLVNSPHVGFGNDMITTKFNYKNSQWAILYSLSYRNYKEKETETFTTFNFPDQKVINRQEIGIKSPFSYKDHNLNFTYNYTDLDKRIINITLKNRIFDYNNNDKSINNYSDKIKTFFTSALRVKNKERNPILDLYYKENLSKNQSLLFNLVGGYIGTKYFYINEESDERMNKVYSYKSNVKGDKYSFIGESNYQLKWNTFNFYAGVNYKLGRIENEYSGTVTENTNLNNSDLYIFTQLQSKINKISYALGMGVSYSQFNDKDVSYRFWSFRPSLSLSYLPVDGLFIQYTFNSFPVTPNLSLLSDVAQIVNDYEMSKGNPNLKPYRTYFNELSASYQKGTFKYSLGVSHQYNKNPFMSEVYFDELSSKFVNTNNNQKFHECLNTYGSINWEIVQNMLSLNVGGQISWMESKGNNYHHKYTSYYYRGQLNFNYKNWNAFIGGHSRYNSLWGETINYGEFGYVAQVGYKYKMLYLGMQCSNFFTSEWSSGNKILSKLKPKSIWTYIDDSAPIFCFHISWNFSWGKQYKSEKKILNNLDSDSGIIKIQ